jgi:ribosomal protein S12 methylthiotransferase
LQALLTATTIPWIRLLYLYPTAVTEDLLDLMAVEPRILPYLDLPLQHISDPVLEHMNRHYTKADVERLLGKVRRKLPHLAIRSTMMVGFPGETEEDIDQLIAFLEDYQLDHVGIFPYADEEGSAAAAFHDKVADATKQQRYDRVMRVQAAISRQRLEEYQDKEETVLIEGLSKESDLLLEGRTKFQAADIDGVVYITDGTANPGDIVQVHITDAHTYDLAGYIVTSSPKK